ncbi:MAG: cellulase family glycosylhydrolase [Sedimentisphaerales bacterium]|jgi:hypothetical protein
MISKKENMSGDINRSLSIAVACVLLCAVSLLYAAPSPLHVEGNKIKDAEGHTVVLRGVSAVDISMLKEWYGIHDYIDRVTNPDDPNGNSPGWYTKVIRYSVCPNDSFVTDSPIVFNPHDITDPNNEAVYEALKEAVDYGAEKGVYSIILWAYAKPIADKVAETNAFWNYMAPKFANDGNVLFELFSEPTDDAGNWGVVKGKMQAWVNIVRTYTADNLCLVTGPCWAQQIGPAVLNSNPVEGDNIVYALHCYGKTWRMAPSWITDQIDAVSPVYPVLVTAWGYEPNSDPNVWSAGSAANFGQPFLDYLEGLGIGNIAASAAYNWSCRMFDPNWQLLCGDYMGCFVKDRLYEKRNAERFSSMTVTRCNITAGKTQGQDSNDISNIKDAFTLSGTFSNIPIDFSQATSIDVNITSSTNGNQVYYESINCNSSRVKGGKFGYTYKIPQNHRGAITALTIDPIRRTFAITAKNVDLTGLSCPVHLELAMGYYTLTGDVNETIVNGKSVLIPTRLMRMYDDTLITSNASAKHGTRPFSDSFSAKGYLAVQSIGVNLHNEDVNFIWGNKVFRVPQGKFTASRTGHLYKCSKVVADTSNGNAGLVTASIDIDNATFAVSVSAADSLDVTSDYIAFGVNFGDFNEVDDVNRVTKRSY